METTTLCDRLCSITNALRGECDRLRFSPHKLALEAIVGQLDALIDQVLDGVATERREQ